MTTPDPIADLQNRAMVADYYLRQLLLADARASELYDENMRLRERLGDPGQLELRP